MVIILHFCHIRFPARNKSDRIEFSPTRKQEVYRVQCLGLFGTWGLKGSVRVSISGLVLRDTMDMRVRACLMRVEVGFRV